MSFEDDRTRQVRTGQAINLAIQLAINEHIGEQESEKSVLARAAELIGPLVQFIDQAQAASLADAQKAAVVQAFPGATLEPAAQQQIPQANPVFVRSEPGGPVVPAQQYTTGGNIQPMAQSQPVQPTPVPGVQDGDPEVAALWQQYFADPSRFWDNRRDKRNPKAPDFKSKETGQGLWVVSKKNPSWVAGRLA